MQTAVQAEQSQAAQSQQLEYNRNQAQYALDQARGAAAGLQGQRQAFEQWDAQRRAEEAAAAEAEARAQQQAQALARQRAQAAEAARTQAATDSASRAREIAVPQGPTSTPPPVSAPLPPAAASRGASASGDVQRVIDRALSQLGVRYPWGGGNANGPTVGVRDGGVADSYGDYYSVGFDCSGLTMYAYAGVGVMLPHFSGYQYTSGTQEPTSQMQPGDLIFYGPGGTQHLISPVRYSGITPYVTRLL